MDFTLMGQIMLAVFSALMSLFVGWYGKKMKSQEEARKEEAEEMHAKMDAMFLGLQSILRNSIITLHDQCMKDGRQKSYHDAQNMEHMYIAYHGLGGNGMVTGIYEDFKTFKIIPRE